MDYVKGVHRGFAFVEYESAEDADEAIFNLDGSELLGQTISVSVAQPNQIHRLTSSNNGGSHHQEAIWTSDEWFQQQISGGGDNNHTASKEEISKQNMQQEDRNTLQRI
jgi:peptidyl-prolyl isomerase E (cyclophilin E)